MKFSKALVVDDSKWYASNWAARWKAWISRGGSRLRAGALESSQEPIPPDLIFMDFMMPEMDGFQAPGIILADPVHPIFRSYVHGQDTAEDRARPLNAALAVLTKPIEDDALRSLLTKMREKVAAPNRILPVPLLPAEVQAHQCRSRRMSAQIENCAGEMTKELL